MDYLAKQLFLSIDWLDKDKHDIVLNNSANILCYNNWDCLQGPVYFIIIFISWRSDEHSSMNTGPSASGYYHSSSREISWFREYIPVIYGTYWCKSKQWHLVQYCLIIHCSIAFKKSKTIIGSGWALASLSVW